MRSAVARRAAGSGTVTVNADRMVTAIIAVAGMTGTAAHIHKARRANAALIVP